MVGRKKEGRRQTEIYRQMQTCVRYTDSYVQRHVQTPLDIQAVAREMGGVGGGYRHITDTGTGISWG